MNVTQDRPPEEIVDVLEYAYQPIVNIHSGVVYGYEALIQNIEQLGFASVGTFFDTMHRRRALPLMCRLLFQKAFSKFSLIPWADRVRLFFNLDDRLLGSEYQAPDLVLDQLFSFQRINGQVCLEIAGRHDLGDSDQFVDRLEALHRSGCKLSVDDFGSGFAGNHLLYHAKPEYVKIDRFYLENMEGDSYKRILATSMVNMAHFVGCYVIAEGVETQTEFYLCKSIGCDLVQGFLIQKPEIDINRLLFEYPVVQQLAERDKRQGGSDDKALLQNEVKYIEPLYNDTRPLVMLETFQKNNSQTFLPVINAHREACGIVRESKVKEYAYSKYGRYLLANPATKKTVESFMDRVPVVDIHTSIDRILDVFASNDTLECAIITDNSEYIGVLRAQSLLRIVNEKNIANAIDQNPLTGLPGNRLIFEYISRALHDNAGGHVIVYFDFDNFKIYNDTYGFRQGDRVILLFAELLKASAHFCERFVGHIGGDDFFLGAENVELGAIVEEIALLRTRFASQVQSFYDQEAMRNGCIVGVDRDGQHRCFPLMSISSAILELPAPCKGRYSPEEVGKTMAEMKKKAKNSSDGMCVSVMGDME